MALFDVFKKKECCICGNEVGLIGNRKLSDGNMCSKCARRLSPWFEDRKESTVEQIKMQLAYREQNAQNLTQFRVDRIIGESDKMYVEEVNGVPTRFFVTDANNYMEANPDIVSFADVVSCVTDIDVRDEEEKRRNNDGQMVSYNPPRYKHHYNFYMVLEIRNNPYFRQMRFRVNSGTVTLESVGGYGGRVKQFGNMQYGGMGRSAFGGGFGAVNSIGDARDHRRYGEYEQMCQRIEQIVEDGKRGMYPGGANQNPYAAPAGFQNAYAANAYQGAPMGAAPAPAAPAPGAATGRPKFCPGCGAPATSGKFCQNCGAPFGGQTQY